MRSSQLLFTEVCQNKQKSRRQCPPLSSSPASTSFRTIQNGNKHFMDYYFFSFLVSEIWHRFNSRIVFSNKNWLETRKDTEEIYRQFMSTRLSSLSLKRTVSISYRECRSTDNDCKSCVIFDAICLSPGRELTSSLLSGMTSLDHTIDRGPVIDYTWMLM